ncbi:DUF2746 domain-containing protein [Mycolicibacterium palauense]|uniref:DUF2746 domain-containing protein n=1 Tax=Mycolicibacterium palauense TaxID=2034511 RepID=UPI000BFEEAA3|nr:DUF2746 domain-containing protein [Mycolicibacterium palauense]
MIAPTPIGDLPDINIPDANDGWDVAAAAAWALTSLLVLILVTFIAVAVRKVLGQVKNSHTDNMRDDLDQKFQALGEQVHEVGQKLGALSAKISAVHEATNDHGGRLNSIEEHLRRRAG